MTDIDRKRTSEESTLKALLNLMKTQGWNAEQAMNALMIPAMDRPLYERSVAYAVAHHGT